MKRQPSTLTRIITAGAERLAQSWSVPPENRAAFITTAISIIEGECAAMRGGERLWTPMVASSTRRQRHARIVEALKSGEAAVSIAQRERLSVQYVRRIRAGAKAT